MGTIEPLPVARQEQAPAFQLNHRMMHRIVVRIVGDERAGTPCLPFIGGSRKEVFPRARAFRVPPPVDSKRSGLEPDQAAHAGFRVQRRGITPDPAAVLRNPVGDLSFHPIMDSRATSQHQCAVFSLDDAAIGSEAREFDDAGGKSPETGTCLSPTRGA